MCRWAPRARGCVGIVPELRSMRRRPCPVSRAVLFVWGGAAGDMSASHETMYGDGAILDLAHDEWAAIASVDAPPPQYGATVATWGDKVALAGGVTCYGSASRHDDALYIYREGASWHRLPGVLLAGVPYVRGPYLARLRDDGSGSGAVFDLELERWTPMPREPRLRPGGDALLVGDAAFGYLGLGNDHVPPFVVADLAAARWCTPALDAHRLFSADQIAASWGGKHSAGMWGAIRVVHGPTCVAPRECAYYPDTYNTLPAGVLITW